MLLIFNIGGMFFAYGRERISPLRGRRIPADAPLRGLLASLRQKTLFVDFLKAARCAALKNLRLGTPSGRSKTSAHCVALKDLCFLRSLGLVFRDRARGAMTSGSCVFCVILCSP